MVQHQEEVERRQRQQQRRQWQVKVDLEEVEVVKRKEERKERKERMERMERMEKEKKEKNLINVEKERASFIKRRQTSGNQIHEFRRKESKIVVVVDSPSSGSDCGNVIVGMNFV